jgi:hypothetical protein
MNAKLKEIAKHTPGPWINCGQNPCYGPDAYFTVGAINGSSVASAMIKQRTGANTHLPERDEAEANAKLIAAAPDMAEALHAIVYGTGAWTTLIENAVAALAKAGLC